jgi:hypothetical protein
VGKLSSRVTALACVSRRAVADSRPAGDESGGAAAVTAQEAAAAVCLRSGCLVAGPRVLQLP